MRLAILLSHPVQYYSPWFRVLAQSERVTLRVFYLWDSGVVVTKDRSFGRSFTWDIPLLDGYDWEFVPNVSKEPGTHHFSGLYNPDAGARIHQWNPDAILFFGYAWRTHLHVLFSPLFRKTSKIYRGDSHALFSQTGVRSALSRSLKRIILRRFSHFFPTGKASHNYLTDLGVRESQITTVPHCVDNERFCALDSVRGERGRAWKEKWRIKSGRPVILFVGKLEKKKRPMDLLEAYLRAQFNRFAERPALVFVGDGDLGDRLKETVKNQEDSDVFFVPFQNQSEIPEAYAAGDVIVLPSFGSGETWGLVVNEAMNLATPAIVSSHVGCGPDLVIEGETGWCFEAGDIDGLRGCLEDAMSDPHRLTEMGRCAQKRIEDFSYRSAAEALEEALSRIGKTEVRPVRG